MRSAGVLQLWRAAETLNQLIAAQNADRLTCSGLSHNMQEAVVSMLM